MQLTVDELLQKCDEILKKSEAKATTALQPLVKKEPAEGEIFSVLELFHMEGYTLNYNHFYLKNENGKNKLDTEWTEFDPEGNSFIPDLNDYLGGIFSTTEYSEKDGIDFTARHEKQLFEWFSSIWKKIGGAKAKVPLYFCFAKDYNCRDLFTGEIMKEEEVTRRLGYIVEP